MATAVVVFAALGLYGLLVGLFALLWERASARREDRVMRRFVVAAGGVATTFGVVMCFAVVLLATRI